MTSYLSLFSGIGGLEHGGVEPLLFCERDSFCRSILNLRHPAVAVHEDVGTLTSPPTADIVAGGWPCQDLSSAGTQQGLRGSRSALFFAMLGVAKRAGAHTLVGENVPNLLSINGGRDFQLLLDTLVDAGFRFIAWRVLNARAFGLPQERRRLFICASTEQERAWSLHAVIPPTAAKEANSRAYGFYWTGGKRSLCFSHGYVPALKIGAADERGRAPVAVFVDNSIRKLSATDFFRLQGFDDLTSAHVSHSSLLRMGGNAVPLPMGRFVMRSIFDVAPSDGIRAGFGVIQGSGFYDDGIIWMVRHQSARLASNLEAFLGPCGVELSGQACAGLLVRSVRSGHKMPLELFDALRDRAAYRTGRLHPSRANSFEALDRLAHEVNTYRETLSPLATYRDAA